MSGVRLWARGWSVGPGTRLKGLERSFCPGCPLCCARLRAEGSTCSRNTHHRDFLARAYFRPCAMLSFDLKFAGQWHPPCTSETRPGDSPGCWQWTSETLSRCYLPCTVSCACGWHPAQHRVAATGWNQHGHQTPASLNKGSRVFEEERDAGTGTG